MTSTVLGPAPQAIAEAFDLGAVRSFTAHQHTSFPTWKVETNTGAYLVKRLWVGPNPQWWPRLQAAMTFEIEVARRGIAVPQTIRPRWADFGVAARVGDATYRAYPWVDHRPVRPDDDLDAWVATTMTVLHAIQPLTTVDEPQWWGLHRRTTWNAWVARAAVRELGWEVSVDRAGPVLEALTSRLRAASTSAGDHVITHGDLEPYNVLVTPEGPVLVDWDSVGPDSAALEAGRAALTFAGHDEDRLVEFLRTYVNAGGQVAHLGPDLFVRPVALDLLHLTEHIAVSLGDDERPGWMQSGDMAATITERVEALEGRTRYLTALASRVQSRLR